jgi:hypothetical protein
MREHSAISQCKLTSFGLRLNLPRGFGEVLKCRHLCDCLLTVTCTIVYSLIHYRLWPGEFPNLGEPHLVAQRLKDETLRSCPSCAFKSKGGGGVFDSGDYLKSLFSK